MIGLSVSFKLFSDMRNSPVNSYDRNSENYQSEDYYETMLSSEFANSTTEDFVNFYEEYLTREGVDLQYYMTPKMLVALGSHRADFENSAKANYREVANTFFRDHTIDEFREFAKECNEKYGVNLTSYLEEEYRRQL